jgi:hypothetical protein
MADSCLLLNNRSRQFCAFEGLAVFGPEKLTWLMNRHNKNLPLSRQRQATNGDPIVLIYGFQKARRKPRENSDALAQAKRKLKVCPCPRVQGLKHGRRAAREFAQNEDIDLVGLN